MLFPCELPQQFRQMPNTKVYVCYSAKLPSTANKADDGYDTDWRSVTLRGEINRHTSCSTIQLGDKKQELLSIKGVNFVGL